MQRDDAHVNAVFLPSKKQLKKKKQQQLDKNSSISYGGNGKVEWFLLKGNSQFLSAFL